VAFFLEHCMVCMAHLSKAQFRVILALTTKLLLLSQTALQDRISNISRLKILFSLLVGIKTACSNDYAAHLIYTGSVGSRKEII